MNSATEQRKSRVLFGVPEGEYYAREFAAVAAAMPEAECRFLGFSWSTGTAVRKAGGSYAHMPLRSRTGEEVLAPPVTEFTSRGHTDVSTPASARRAFSAFSAFLEAQVDEFQPDLVVYGPIDHSVCFLLDRIAQGRGVSRLGLQPSFVSNRFIVQSHGPGWVEQIRSAQLPERQPAGAEASSERGVVVPRRVPGSKSIWSRHLWVRGAESALRVLTGGVTFDTCKSLWFLFTSWVAPRKWFPELETLQSLEQRQRGYVLVALHQPALCPWGSPTWLELVDFALASTPEDVVIVLRPHPVEPAVRLPEGLLAKLWARGARVSRAGDGPDLADVIRNCRALITLNSATGIEALLAGVPVLALAPAFYAREGMAVPVSLSEAQKVREALRGGELPGPDPAAVERFTRWLASEHMVHALHTAGAGENGLVERIRRALAERQLGL